MKDILDSIYAYYSRYGYMPDTIHLTPSQYATLQNEWNTTNTILSYCTCHVVVSDTFAIAGTKPTKSHSNTR